MVIFLVICIVVALCVMIHYELLFQLSRWMPRMVVRHRLQIIAGVVTALIAHMLEIWIFASAYFLLNRSGQWGALQGNYDGGMLDSAYFSFTTFTTLGFGDIEPVGSLRLLVGVESLTGLVLVTWTATYLYIEMTRYWKLQGRRKTSGVIGH